MCAILFIDTYSDTISQNPFNHICLIIFIHSNCDNIRYYPLILLMCCSFNTYVLLLHSYDRLIYRFYSIVVSYIHLLYSLVPFITCYIQFLHSVVTLDPLKSPDANASTPSLRGAQMIYIENINSTGSVN